VGFGCCSIHSRSRSQGNTKALWDGWEEKGLRAGGWELGGEGCGPCKEEAPAQMERRLSSQTMQQHSLPSFSAYLQGGQRYPWRRQVGQALSLFLSLSLTLSSSMFT